MKKKLLLILISIIFIIIITPTNNAFANSWDYTSKTVTIDTPWTGNTLESTVKNECYRVTDIVILNITAGMLTDDDVMWVTKNLSNLETLSISGSAIFDNNDLPDYAFNANPYYGKLTKLKNISIDLDDENSIKFGNFAFYNCELLTDINMPNIIEFSNNAFSGCIALTNISLPKAETFGSSAFYRCLLLTDVSLPNVITFGDNAFSGYNAITKIVFPEAISFGKHAFSYCSMLTDISLPKATTFGDNAFSYCTNLTDITLPEAITFGKETFIKSKKLTTIDLPKATTFGEKSFYELSVLTSVNLPEAITFGECAFSGCTSLTSISLPKVTTFDDSALYKCKALTTIDLPEATTFGNCAFQNCDALTTLTLPKATSFDDSAFCSCDSLTSINLPEAISFKRYAFRESNALLNVNLPKATTFGREAFYKCAALTNISLPEAKLFEANAFYECPKLTNVIMPKVTKIGDTGFWKCISLISVNLSEIKEFGGYQFGQCFRPITMTLGSTPPVEIGQPYPGGTCRVFYNSSNYGPSKIVVPQSAVDTYEQNLDGYGRWYYWVIDSLSDDATLYDLRINGKRVDDFESTKTLYNLNSTKSSTIEIVAYKSDTNAIITGDTGTQNLNYGDNSFTITVTAEDETTTKDYIINITRGYELSYSAGIGGSLTGTTTQIVAPNDNGTEVTSVPANGYKFTKWSDNKTEASRTETNITSDITLVAEFTRLSNDATLSDIKLDAETLNNFDPLTTTYTLEITTASSIEIDATKNDNYASISGDTGSHSLNYGPNSFTITATAEDNTAKDYIIIVTKGYELSYTAGAGGSLTGTTTQIVAPNDNGTEVTSVPANGYKFTKWSDNKTEASRTDTNITSNASIIAEFKIHHSNSNKHNTVKGNSGNDSFTAGTKKTIYNSRGKKETIVTVKQNAIKEQIKKVSDKDKISIPVESKEDISKAIFTVQSVKDMQDKNLTLEVKTDDVSYELPTNLIDIDTISNEIGEEIALSDIDFTVKISKTNDEMIKVVESSIENDMLEIVVPPVDFEIEATHKGKCCKINKFNSFVKRTIEIPSNISADKITTAVITEADGSIRHVPTYITKIDGKYYATINSLTNSTYTLIYNEVTFSDVSLDHWAKKDIEKMASRLVVEGKKDGTFAPNESITRAELAQILVKALGLKPEKIDKFVDVENNYEYGGYIGTAYNYGIIKGTSETTFNPFGLVTRQDAMTMIYRTAKIINKFDENFAIDMAGYIDYKNVSNYAKESVMWNVSNGIIRGKSPSTLVPLANITRAELSAVTNRFLKSANLID